MTHPPLDNPLMNPHTSPTWPHPSIKKIPVFYDERQVANPESFSPSAQKPSLLIRSWVDEALPITLMPVTPVSREQLALAHDRSYVVRFLNSGRRTGLASAAKALPIHSHGPPARSFLRRGMSWRHGLWLFPPRQDFTMRAIAMPLDSAPLMD
jgi:hypothetical protein